MFFLAAQGSPFLHRLKLFPLSAMLSSSFPLIIFYSFFKDIIQIFGGMDEKLAVLVIPEKGHRERPGRAVGDRDRRETLTVCPLFTF